MRYAILLVPLLLFLAACGRGGGGAAHAHPVARCGPALPDAGADARASTSGARGKTSSAYGARSTFGRGRRASDRRWDVTEWPKDT